MKPDAFYFCTYFDHRYLVRGLALIQSLQEHCPAFTIWVLCLDGETHSILSQMDLPEVQAIHIQDFERANPELVAVKPQRTTLEYYFTCTPSLPRFVLDHQPDVDLITYLDADLYFFGDPTPLFEEFGTGSIGIMPQRRSAALQASTPQVGTYIVSWVTFRRDAAGLACLRWWRDRCIEWCYYRREDGKFGDQKYLDQWPARFSGVVVLSHIGADVAKWNIANYRLTEASDHRVYVDGRPLIFYHFSSLTQIRSWLYNPRFHRSIKPTKILRRRVYGQYVRALTSLEQHVNSAIKSSALDDKTWQEMRQSAMSQNLGSAAAPLSRRLYHLVRGIVSGRLLVRICGRVF